MNLKGDLRVNEIVQVEFPRAQYYPVEHPKSQIVLHHSAGWDNVRGMFDGWKANPERVGTCMGINDSGTIFQIYDDRMWAYHVNILSKGNNSIRQNDAYFKYFSSDNAVSIENRTVAVEVCNWGQLTNIDGRFHTWASSAVTKKPGRDIILDDRKVIEYSTGFRGYHYYERYTDQEIEQLWRLVRHWCKKFEIPTKLVGNIFEINVDALKGTRGVYTHCSYRIDKQDLHPQPELVEALNSL